MELYSTDPYVFMTWYLIKYMDNVTFSITYSCNARDGVSKSFRTGRMELELQIVQLSATRCSFIAIL